MAPMTGGSNHALCAGIAALKQALQRQSIGEVGGGVGSGGRGLGCGVGCGLGCGVGVVGRSDGVVDRSARRRVGAAVGAGPPRGGVGRSDGTNVGTGDRAVVEKRVGGDVAGRGPVDGVVAGRVDGHDAAPSRVS